MSIKDIAAAYEAIDKQDLRTLMVMEVLHKHHEYVPVERLIRWLNHDEGAVRESLRRLNKFSLVSREGEVGYRLTYGGYDILAIHALAKKGIIESLSPTPIGSGKESDVYAVQLPTGEEAVVKFHRLGRTSFRGVRRYRMWLGERRHISWLYESRLSARMEYTALSGTYRAGIPVPRPIAVNRHAVVMDFIDGVELAEAYIDDPEDVWNEIMTAVDASFNAGYIHGDLSEFNILMADKAFLIDWPQWVPVNVINGIDYLIHDINTLASFFSRRYDYRPETNELVKEYRDRVNRMVMEEPDKVYNRLLDELIYEIDEETKDAE